MSRSIVLPLLLSALLPAAASAFEDELEAPEQEAQPHRVRAALLLRGDLVSGLPGGREDLERVRGRIELGIESTGREGLRYGLAAMAMAGSDRNRDNLANLDNEKSNGAALSEAWIGFGWERLTLAVGKAPVGVHLTPLVWDADLRPIGVVVGTGAAIGEFDRWELSATLADPDHPLANGGSRMAAVQLAWHWREGGASSASARIGLIDFSRIDALRRSGLARGNSLGGGRYVQDYRLLDLQLDWRLRAGDRPLHAELNLVRNLEANADRDGARLSLRLGDAMVPRSWEFGYALQRFQRDAVLAAYTSDDWWFHTAARGYMPWIGYGFDRRWRLQLSGFRETRDGLDESTTRWLLDLSARW